MLTIKFTMGQIVALCHILEAECSERREKLIQTKLLRNSYTTDVVSDDMLSEWVLGDQARLEEATELWKLFIVARSRV